MFDPSSIRAHFPALQAHPDTVFFDNPAGTQVPQAAIDGYTNYLIHDNANEGGSFPTSRRTGNLITEARAAMADFLAADRPDEIVFGQNMTSLTFHLSRAIGDMLQPGDQIVTTRLEHDANVAPWLSLLDRGIEVRFVDIHPETGTLDLDSARTVIGPRTRLLAVGLASNALGTVNDVRTLADMAHAHGAWVFVDAVHYAPHGPIEVAALGADLLACSAYKFFGPHLGILYGRYEVLDTLPIAHVRPAGNHPPASWETGTQNYEAYSALLGTISYLSSLSPIEGTRRERLHDAMSRIRAYERTLSAHLIAGLTALPGVTVYGLTDPASFEHRVPTVSFTVAGHDPHAVATALAGRGINSWAGNHYALEPLGRLGLDATQRIGLTHYNTLAEIDRFLQALSAVTSEDGADVAT